ncbi:MaoC family dehydratase [Candidatus Sumerlaeota bacterium]|nr:MaoC family dehydratase [Candidatus Sumerlaeota bacterium]
MTSKTNPGNYFEDFQIGQTIEHAVPRTITEGDCALYVALYADRYPLYCDAEFARKLGYRRELVNDLLVFHIVFGKSVPDISLNARANLGYAEVQFLKPVYPGDTLNSISKVLGKKENKSLKDGNVYVRTQGFNQHGEAVLQFYRWVMVKKKNESAAAGDNQIPNLPKEVNPADLAVDASLDLTGFDPRVAGGRWFFEDYAAGERIHHDCGMTIEEAEHQMATRLYQNTAKVHFDQHIMKDTPAGRRLVYGGHVISLARAISFNGLENVLRVLAWNGGAHANPTYAGETLYAFTDILDKKEIPGRADCAALRLRLVAVKNLDPMKEAVDIKVKDDKGGEKYHPNVVLDLDYYALVPNKG